MTRNEPLWETYEDAAFAILMDAVAEQEGKQGLQLLNELAQDPASQVPEAVQRRAEETIRKTFAAKKRDAMKHAAWKVVRRVVIAVAAVTALMAGIFAAFPEVRAAAQNLVEQTFSECTGIDITAGDPREYTSAQFRIAPGWLPPGFSLSDEGQNNASVFHTYENPSGGVIFISESTAENTSMAVDTEDAVIETISVQGYEGTLVQKEGFLCILFLVPERNMLVYLDAENIPAEQLLQVAENLDVQ